MLLIDSGHFLLSSVVIKYNYILCYFNIYNIDHNILIYIVHNIIILVFTIVYNCLAFSKNVYCYLVQYWVILFLK